MKLIGEETEKRAKTENGYNGFDEYHSILSLRPQGN
jgi:hypothetical protein